MSVHRIEIKPRRECQEPETSTPKSSIAVSDISGRPPGNGDEDDDIYPEYEPTVATPIAQSAPCHSTGPRTDAGKAASSLNAIKHCLTRPAGSMRFLPGEDSSGHDQLILQFNEQFVPMTGAERECIRGSFVRHGGELS
jgi:hypothetical protein